MIEYEFYCVKEKTSTNCNPKMHWCFFTSPRNWCRIFSLSFQPIRSKAMTSNNLPIRVFSCFQYFACFKVQRSRTSLSTNQIKDDNQLRLSYSHLPALQTLCLFYLEALLAKRDVSSVLIGYCNYFSNDSIDWLLWLLFSVVEKLTQEPIIRVVKKSSTIPSSQWSVRSAAHLDHR